MIDVKRVSGHIEASVFIAVTGAPPLKATHQECFLQSTRIQVRYAYKPETVGGWTVHHWSPVDVSVVGPRILKPAADGTQRLGVDDLSYRPVYGVEHPEWLRQLVDKMTPSGEVTLAGV